MRRLAVGVALVAAVTLTACDSDRRAISRDDLPDLPEMPQHVVELGDDGFDRERLEVRTDELVRFVVTGRSDHGIRADSRINTGPLFPGEDTVVMFSEADTYTVVDSENEGPTLTVVATDPDPASP